MDQKCVFVSLKSSWPFLFCELCSVEFAHRMFPLACCSTNKLFVSYQTKRITAEFTCAEYPLCAGGVSLPQTWQWESSSCSFVNNFRTSDLGLRVCITKIQTKSVTHTILRLFIETSWCHHWSVIRTPMLILRTTALVSTLSLSLFCFFTCVPFFKREILNCPTV